MKKIIAVSIMALFLCWACTSAQIITLVEVALEAASIAFPIVSSAAGLPASQITAIMGYLQDANTALGQVSDVIAAGGTQAEIATKITGILSKIVAPDLTGLPAAIANAVSAVSQDILSVLQKYGSVQAFTLKSYGARQIHFSGKNLARLTSVKAKAQANVAAIQVWKSSRSK